MHWDGQEGASSGILVNGRGRYFEDSLLANPLYKKFWNTTTDYINFNPFSKNFLNYLPMAYFYVTSGKRYRFRMMNPGFTICPIRVTIDNHSMIVIATDTSPVQPTKVRSLVIFPGERCENCRLRSYFEVQISY
jgi:FtsP/CotA-like multicopper oxidase with cupredoxin domain